MKFFFILFFLYINSLTIYSQTNFYAFTHPKSKKKIKTYLLPHKFYSYLYADKEAGWIVQVEKENKGYFKIKLPEECSYKLKEIWVKSGDIGVVIQNYESFKVPVYKSFKNKSKIIFFINKSIIAKIYDFKNSLVLIKVVNNKKEIWGWIEQKYLCGNPYTTCN